MCFRLLFVSSYITISFNFVFTRFLNWLITMNKKKTANILVVPEHTLIIHFEHMNLLLSLFVVPNVVLLHFWNSAFYVCVIIANVRQAEKVRGNLVIFQHLGQVANLCKGNLVISVSSCLNYSCNQLR